MTAHPEDRRRDGLTDTGHPPATGVCLRSRSTQIRRQGARLMRRLIATAATALTVAFALSGLLMTTTSPASADIFGIGDTVQEWICGMVRPTEPWESVGDGPESWLSNRNLGQIERQPPKTLTADGSISVDGETPVAAPSDMDQILAMPDGQYTLYEAAGLRGLSWWTIPLQVDGKTKDCSVWNYLWTEAGNLLFTFNKTALQIVIALKEAASADNPLNFLYDASGGTLSGLFTLFFVPIACLMLIATGMWAGMQAVRNRGTRATFGAIGATFAITALAGFLYLAATSATSGQNGFRQVAHIADQGIASINGAAASALFDNFTASSSVCNLDPAGDPASRGQRITSCVLADALAYRPWAIGQFGGRGANPIPLPDGWNPVAPAGDGKITFDALAGKAIPCYVKFNECKELRSYLIAQHGGVQIGGALNGQQGYNACTASTQEVVATQSDIGEIINILNSARCSPMYQVFTVLTDSDPTAARAYSGSVGIARVSQALSAIIGTAVAGFAILINSIISMGWHAYTFVLYLVGPIKLAFATFGGKTRMAREWFGDLVYAWLARLAYGIVLTFTILVVVWLLSSDISFGMRLVWLAVILFLFWKLMGKVQGMLKPHFASNDNPDMMGGLNKATRVGRNTVYQAGRRTSAGLAGASMVRDRHQLSATDPTRGALRRAVSASTLPGRMFVGGVRGAVTGSTGVQRRALQEMTRASLRHQASEASRRQAQDSAAPEPAVDDVDVEERGEQESDSPPDLQMRTRRVRLHPTTGVSTVHRRRLDEASRSRQIAMRPSDTRPASSAAIRVRRMGLSAGTQRGGSPTRRDPNGGAPDTSVRTHSRSATTGPRPDVRRRVAGTRPGRAPSRTASLNITQDVT